MINFNLISLFSNKHRIALYRTSRTSNIPQPPTHHITNGFIRLGSTGEWSTTIITITHNANIQHGRTNPQWPTGWYRSGLHQ